MEKKKKVTEIAPEKKDEVGGGNEKKLKVASYCRVSTNDEEQAKSYKNQVESHEQKIKNNPNYEFVGTYGDDGISGTKAETRPGFSKMMNDAAKGNIDLIITKSISRFMRNTSEMLSAINELKKINVSVLFEEENINTSNVGGDLLLTILSAIAQMEVENTSNHIKHSIRNKMKNGEIVGFTRCLGYSYDQVEKKIKINEDEAEIVKMIFNDYAHEGIGSTLIAKKLEDMKIETPGSSKKWNGSAILGIIKNEKYVGDVMQGKTITMDPISKKRVKNKTGSMFHIENNHEAIISRSTWEKAKDLRLSRNTKGNNGNTHYAFTSKLICGFCGDNLTRRNWNSGSDYSKTVWHCKTSAKNGKVNCQHSKGISEEVIEKGFIEVYNYTALNRDDIINKALDIYKKNSEKPDWSKKLDDIERKIEYRSLKKRKLLDLLVDEKIPSQDYDESSGLLASEISKLQADKEFYLKQRSEELSVEEKIENIRQHLRKSSQAESFRAEVFETIIEKVIVGSKDSIDPYELTFVFKTGKKTTVNSDIA